jgi:chaperonin cofactor prefoldin
LQYRYQKDEIIKDIQQHVDDLDLNDEEENPGAKILESELIKERDETIQELRETIMLMEVKMKKLEQLVKMKDSKIEALQAKLEHAGLE